MAFYKSPFRPFDPVIPQDGEPQPTRYLRDNFAGTGQDSFTNPPAQDQAEWQQLINVMPITEGTLAMRWGSQLFIPDTETGSFNVAHMYSYQNDVTGFRAIVTTDSGASSNNGGLVWDENGNLFSSLFARANNGDPPFRMINSRNYAYFYNGTVGGAQKWNGVQNSGITNWGINPNAVANSSTAGFAGTIASSGAWTNPSNMLGPNNAGLASFSLPSGGATGVPLLENYGLSASGTILGIQADCYVGMNAVSGGGTPKTIRPNAGTVSGNGIWGNIPFAFDNNPTTASVGSASAPNGNILTESEQVIYSGFPSVGSPTPQTLTLVVTASAFTNADPGGSGSASFHYSLDGGVTQILIAAISSNQTLNKHTYNIPIPATQDTTKVRVFGFVSAHGRNPVHGTGGAFGNASASIFDLAINVTYSTTAPATAAQINAVLLKNGIAYGALKSSPINPNNGQAVYGLGGAGDLWGGAWLPADVNASNFGIQFQIIANGGAIAFCDAIRLTVFMSGGGPLLGSKTSGSVTLIAGRTYYLVAKNSSTGHYSDLSAASNSTGALTSQQQALTLPVYSDPQVDVKALLATADGNDPSILYLVTELANATTTFTDNTPDPTLVLQQVFLTTDTLGNETGVAGNLPPPTGNLAIKHKGRLWMAQGQNVFFSKSVQELTLPNGFVAGKYEESWPASNYFDVSQGAETIRGLFTDGATLYIGTERHIRQIYGDNPNNFQQPEIVHQEVGLLNQDVWIPVYLEGTPSGAMWLTPDNRVVGSDFNAYADIGHPIQDVLNTINGAAAPTVAHAMFVSSASFDLFILAIPTGTNTACDTHCVFDLRSKRWFVWLPTDPSTSMLFHINKAGQPLWLFATQLSFAGPPAVSNSIFQYTPSTFNDRTGVPGVNPVAFPISATTSWLHLATPTQKKILNDIDVIGDPGMTITVQGANNQNDFNNPMVVVSNQPIVVDPLGQYKVFLAGQDTDFRYYQFIFTSSGTQTDFLDSYSIWAIPQTAL